MRICHSSSTIRMRSGMSGPTLHLPDEHAERRAAIERALDLHLAVVGGDDLLHDRQPQAESAAYGAVIAPAVELVEDVGDILSGDADSVVRDFDRGVPPPFADAHVNQFHAVRV